MSKVRIRLILGAAQLLHVNGMFLSQALTNRRLVILLTGTELLDNSRTFEFSFKLFEGALDVFAFLDWYYNHFLICFFILLLLIRTLLVGCKIKHLFYPRQIWPVFFEHEKIPCGKTTAETIVETRAVSSSPHALSAAGKGSQCLDG